MADPYAGIATPVQKNADPYAAFSTPVTAGGVQDYEPEQYSTGQKVARGVGLTAQGFNDAIATAAGAPVDAAAWLLRQAGINANNPVGGSESIKRGIDYVASIPGKIGLTSPDTPVRLEPTNATERFAHGAGEGVGNALTVMVPAGLLAQSGRFGPVTTGVLNALRTQPVMQVAGSAAQGGVTEATGNPLLGMAAGIAVPVAASVGRGIVSPVTPRLTPQEARLVQAAQDEGITLTPAQLTGSPSLRGIEETMARMPLSNGPMQNALREQREQFNRAVTSRTGTTAADAAPETLDRIRTGLGQVFDNLAQQTTLNIDPQFGADVRRVAQDYGRRLTTDVKPVFQSYMRDLEPLLQAVAPGAPGSTLPAPISNANPQIAGEIYQRIRSDITTRMRETSDLPLRRALGGIVEALDDVMERSATSPALRDEWQEARRQYQALMTIDKAMQGGTQASRSAGDIPYNSLTTAVRGADKEGYSRGRGQLNELARIGDYIASRVPNSGTPERLAWQNILTGGGLFTAGAASGIGLPAAAVGAAAPFAISRLYNSPAGRAYLTNQIAGQTDLNALYGGLAARQAIAEGTGGQNSLVRQRPAR